MFQKLLVGILFLTPFTSAFAETLTPEAMETKIRQASIARGLAVILSSPLDNQVKEALLKTARSEDSEYVRSLIVRWKPQPVGETRAEFSTVIWSDEETEVRIQPIGAGVFLINGREWKAPETGSISKALRQRIEEDLKQGPTDSAFLWHKLLQVSIPESAAAPARASVEATKTAYIFTTANLGNAINAGENLLASAVDVTRLKRQSEEPNPPPKTWYQTLLGSVFSSSDSKVEVRCDGTVARGKTYIGPDLVDYESREGGKIKLTFADKSVVEASPVEKANLKEYGNMIDGLLAQLERAKPSDQSSIAQEIWDESPCDRPLYVMNGELAQYCRQYRQVEHSLDGSKNPADRQKTVTSFIRSHREALQTSAKSLQQTIVLSDDLIFRDPKFAGKGKAPYIFAPRPKSPVVLPKEARDALAFKPASGNAKIVSGCPKDQNFCSFYRLEIETDGNGKRKLSQADQKRAQDLVKAANTAIRVEEAKRVDAAKAVLALGSCCGDLKCRQALAKKDIQFVDEKKTTR